MVILREQGHSQAEIALQTGVSRCGVQAILKKQQKTGKVEDRKRSGRPRKRTKKDGTYLKITSLRNRKKNKLGSCCRTRSNIGETSTLIDCKKITHKEMSKWQDCSQKNTSSERK